jgi:hypothetical protein
MSLELTSAPPPDYRPGDLVSYLHDPENLWTVLSLSPGVDRWWARAYRGSTNKTFPADVFTRVEAAPAAAPTPRPAKSRATRAPRRTDPVAWLLAEAQGLEQVWQIAALAGLDCAELRPRIAHLSPGLQSMNVANHLRKLDRLPVITWTPEGFKKC